jgi:magnesium chelatase subunit I
MTISCVSARLTISAFENAVSAAERRAIINNEKQTQVWIADLAGIIPSITGKIELVYEGEQEGPFQVAMNSFGQSNPQPVLFNIFLHRIHLRKKNSGETCTPAKDDENPYRSITAWFDKGNQPECVIQYKRQRQNNPTIPGGWTSCTR